ncbi:hypothetical protein IIC65_08590 [Candidatus Sumerlaeota bacterium]|nr:hypothetical protein [Candidatus Sumerlaeota bacterium]
MEIEEVFREAKRAKQHDPRAKFLIVSEDVHQLIAQCYAEQNNPSIEQLEQKILPAETGVSNVAIGISEELLYGVSERLDKSAEAKVARRRRSL